MNKPSTTQINLYQTMVIFSVLFSLLGFSYNVWRMEATEKNSNIRTACFEILLNLSSLEQLVYTAHYDDNTKEASPRKGWVTVGLVVDLSTLTSSIIEEKSITLRNVWSTHWETMPTEKDSVNNIVNAIDSIRTEIKLILSSLE